MYAPALGMYCVFDLSQPALSPKVLILIWRFLLNLTKLNPQNRTDEMIGVILTGMPKHP